MKRKKRKVYSKNYQNVNVYKNQSFFYLFNKIDSINMIIPSSIKSIDVSSVFVSRVPRFLDEIEHNPELVLVVIKNDINRDFMEKIHPTDELFYFFMKKFISLPSDLNKVDPLELEKKVSEFFQL